MNPSHIPTPAQASFQSWEFGLLFHFGIRTFYEGHRDWDGLEMKPDAFCPAELDCRQWIRTAKEAGAQYAILVTKHHDGFANWPSRYSSYSVAQTPWRGGKGDLVAEFTDACREFGLHVGLYYSPAQEGFGAQTETEYDTYFIHQITELLTNYGKIDYLWFDACGSGEHRYDTQRILQVIRSLQKDILIFNMWDPDTRWIGNESGVAGLDNRSFVRALDIAVDAAGQQQLQQGCYLPAECDCSIRGHDWFFSAFNAHKRKSADELFGLYCASVGNGANLLLNVAPDRRGLLPEADCAVLREFAEKVRHLYGGALCHTVEQHADRHYYCYLRQPELVGGVILEERLYEGEGIDAFHIEVCTADGCQFLPVYYGKAVGNKRICFFPPMRTALLRIVLDECRPGASLLNITVLPA